MMDINLRALTREALDLALGDLIGSEGASVNERVLLDRIGPITRQIGTDGSGNAIFETISDYHANLRFLDNPSEAQVAALAGVTIAQPASPYRVWAS